MARLLRGIWWSVGALGGLLAASWEPLGASLRPLGDLLGALGALLGSLGSSWGLLERSWGLLETSWEPPGTILGAFWRHLMAVWGRLRILESLFEAIS